MLKKQIAAKAGRKLSGSAGETIVEVLLGTLIVSAATIALVTMIAVGARLTADSERMLDDYYTAVGGMADFGTGVVTDGKLDYPVRLTSDIGADKSVKVKYKTAEKNGITIVSYVYDG